MSESKLIRKNIFMSKQIANFYEEQAELTGMSQSNLMVMALNQYMMSARSLDLVDVMKKLNDKLEDQPPLE